MKPILRRKKSLVVAPGMVLVLRGHKVRTATTVQPREVRVSVRTEPSVSASKA